MEFKPMEIVAIIVALAIPISLFAILLIPGAGNAVYNFAMDRDNTPYVFGVAAAVVAGVLVYRIYSRIRPRKRD